MNEIRVVTPPPQFAGRLTPIAYKNFPTPRQTLNGGAIRVESAPAKFS